MKKHHTNVGDNKMLSDNPENRFGRTLTTSTNTRPGTSSGSLSESRYKYLLAPGNEQVASTSRQPDDHIPSRSFATSTRSNDEMVQPYFVNELARHPHTEDQGELLVAETGVPLLDDYAGAIDNTLFSFQPPQTNANMEQNNRAPPAKRAKKI